MTRFRDISLSLFFLFLLGPWFLLIIILLAITQDKVFFRQERTGWKKQPFFMLKFSTLRDILPGEKEEEDQKYRLTKMGKFLRRFSIDEWPQLINVLKGEMSLVGPRPLLHDYLSLYSEEQVRRFELRPGITGHAQLNGRNLLTFTERFELDVWYVDHRSFWMDLKIMIQTPFKLLKGRGVYSSETSTMDRFDGTN